MFKLMPTVWLTSKHAMAIQCVTYASKINYFRVMGVALRVQWVGHTPLDNISYNRKKKLFVDILSSYNFFKSTFFMTKFESGNICD